MSRTATIKSLPEAFEVIKQMRDQGYGVGADCRRSDGPVVAGIWPRAEKMCRFS